MYTCVVAAPRAAVKQLNQHTRHVMGAQHAIDNTDTGKKDTFFQQLYCASHGQ